MKRKSNANQRSAEIAALPQLSIPEELRYQLSAIVDSSDDAIIAKTLKGIITSWNKGAEYMYGYKAKEVIGKPISILVPQEIRSDLPMIFRHLKRGERIDHYETKRRRKDGKIVDVSVTISPIKNEKGKVIGASAIARDITEQKRMQLLKEDFISIASHELKTPVTSVKVYTQLLQRLVEQRNLDQAAGILERMDNQLSKLSGLVADLLDVSRIQSGRLPLHKERFNPNQMLEEIVKDFQQTVSTHVIIVKCETSKKISADKDRLSQVVINLLSNAVKYSRKQHKVIVRVYSDQKNLIVSVKDFGVGIPKEEQTKIFERFYRVQESKQLITFGQGLGLYISAEIISNHGGRMWVRSQVGKGSTFFFTLPFPIGHKRR